MSALVIEKWNDILDYLKTEFNITQVSFNTWLKNLKVNNINSNTLFLTVNDTNIGSNIGFIKNKYGLFIKTAIAEITNKEYNIEFISDNNEKENIPETKIVNPNNQNLSLIPSYTFDNFVVSSNNAFALASALKVAEAPSEYYNPLYIYGDVGLGKTHLMHSIAHFIIDNSPSLKVMYVTSEKFTNELIEAIRHGNITPPAFREKYRNVDVLLIDDIQFIIGKESTQEEFFHTFNALYEAKKQIVISSDKPPKDMATLEERLRSRFGWGLLVGLTSPDFETKMAILKKKSELGNYNISDDVLSYIASNVNTNIRELEGALTKVVAMSRINRQVIDLSLAEYSLRDIIFPNKKKIITPEFIIELVAEHFLISVPDLLSTKRDRSFSSPRQIAMYLCKNYTSTSTTDLGKVFNKDHSTVLHGASTIDNKIKSDEKLKNTVELLVKKINPDTI